MVIRDVNNPRHLVVLESACEKTSPITGLLGVLPRVFPQRYETILLRAFARRYLPTHGRISSSCPLLAICAADGTR